MSGDEADVQCSAAGVGNDVIGAVLLQGGVDAGGAQAGHAQELVAPVLFLVGVLHLMHGGEKAGHVGDGVDARVGHGAVGHLPLDGDVDPHDALLRDAQAVVLGLADDGRAHVLGPTAAHEVFHAQHEPFLVCQRAQEDVSLEANARVDQGFDGDHGRGQPSLHVARAATVDAPVHNLPAEGVIRPRVAVALGHHVRVPFEHEATAPFAPRQDGDDIGAAGRGPLEVGFQAHFFATGLDPARGLGFHMFPAGAGHRVKAHQFLRPADEKILIDVFQGTLFGGCKHGSLHFGHWTMDDGHKSSPIVYGLSSIVCCPYVRW